MRYAVRLQPMASDGRERDERAGRAAAELKETEDLLAGFDRPGRTPRTPPAARDFVDYHLEKGRSSPDARRPPRSPDVARRDLPTAIIPGPRRTPAWATWTAVALIMTAGGIGVAAFLASPRSTAPSPTASLAANAAPTEQPPAVDPTSGPARDIPPPPPPSELLEPSAPGAAETTSSDTRAPTVTPPAPAPPTTRRLPAAGTEAPPSVAPAEPAPAPANVTPSADFIRTL